MFPSLSFLTASVAVLSSVAQAQYDATLVGTWSTKSKKVLTGPGFYDPVNDKFTEPTLTGISYSFTNDGWYEEAFYRTISNPQVPSCPSAIMQWQHGRYTLPGNGSIILTPIAVDGRQQTSSPCVYESSLYIRYNQPELMSKYAVYTDPYHNVPRLDLFQFDGSPMHPMFLEYSPPQMLPTQTLNPTSTAAGTTATASSKLRKRGLGGHFDEQQHVINNPKPLPEEEDHWLWNANNVWWAGAASVGIGSFIFMLSS